MTPIGEPVTHSIHDRPGDDRPGDEAIFRQEMEAAGATVSSWGNGPGDRYGLHSHSYRKVLYCAQGSIVFHLPEADVELVAGSRLVIDPSTAHSAEVGGAGVRCVEAHLHAGVHPPAGPGPPDRATKAVGARRASSHGR